MSIRIAILPGDGIGPEVTAAAGQVLRRVAEQRGEALEMIECSIGGAAIDASGSPLPPSTLDACRTADAVLLGAVGGARWNDPALEVRPEQGLLALRKELGLYANLRPVRLVDGMLDLSPLRPERVRGADLMIVRELTGGIYFGEKSREGDRASDLCEYTVQEVERIVRVAGRIATERGGGVTSVDKANVLATSRLWREVTTRVMAEEFPALELEHVLVDAMAMYLVDRPTDFDVIVTENMFGDILSDAASVLPGSLGLLPSASLGDGESALYEPIHGSAPDIAGQNIANPLGAIASVAMLVRHSLGWQESARAIDEASESVLRSGVRTYDIGGSATTSDVTNAVLSELDSV